METIIIAILSVVALGFGYLWKNEKSRKNNSQTIVDTKTKETLAANRQEIEDLQAKLNTATKANLRKDLQELKEKLEKDQITLRSDFQTLESEKLKVKNDLSEGKSLLTKQEQSLNDRERNLINRATKLDERFIQLQEKENDISKKESELQEHLRLVNNKLYEVSNLTKEEAQRIVMHNTEDEMKGWIAKRIRESEKDVQTHAEQKAQEILIDSMINSATDYISDVAVTRFQLQSEEQKGKIIGKEGRNIKMLEKLTGVEVIVDEDNASVTISCFDPIRREVAAISIARLLKDGRMHPGTIEDTVEKVKKDLLKILKKEGEELAYKAGFSDLPEEIIKLLGKYRFRFSYGQNLARHTLEVVTIAESIAKDLKLDISAVKLAALLHDIGKVVITDSLGTDERQHHHISADIARKYNMSDKVVNAIEAHHEDIPSRYLEAEVIKIADAISGGRIGARRENYEEYIKRIKALEDIAKSYEGVKEAYAIYAGREIRIIVEPQKLTDDEITILSQKIAKQIQDTQNYPGSIKVTVIRETRAIANA